MGQRFFVIQLIMAKRNIQDIPAFTGKDPRKGWRIPLDEIKYNEQQDYESGFHYYGARYYDSEVLTGWLSVDPMMDKYFGIEEVME